jgi:hypothetical protein
MHRRRKGRQVLAGHVQTGREGRPQGGLEDIYRYARAPEHEHRPAWQAFNARAREAGSAVGIWHETYAVPAGGHESVYVAVPPMDLARATSVVPVARRGQTARERLRS